MSNYTGSTTLPGFVKGILLAVIILIVSPFMITNLFEHQAADEIMVVQSPISGKLTWTTTPGVKWQGFGTATKYHKRNQFWFSEKADQGKKGDESIKVRFNDGAHANISGSLSVELPTDDIHLTLLHTKYGNEDAVMHQLIRTNLEKAIYMTGPTMSSAQSYAERRNDLLGIIEDQFTNGVYRTVTRDEKVLDPVSGKDKTIKVVEPAKSKDGQIERAEISALLQFNIKSFNFSINAINYDPIVDTQIKTQQEAIMAVQTAMAQSKKAEQDVLTVASKGAADAAKAEWEQKVISAKAQQLAEQEKAVATTKAEQEKKVAETKAEQELKVAELGAKAAEQTKKANIALGEGEAERKKLVMAADGALERKLEAYITVNEKYAKAMSDYKGNWVPGIIMGGTPTAGVSGVNSAQNLMDMLMLKTAKDLSLDLSLPAHTSTIPLGKGVLIK